MTKVERVKLTYAEDNDPFFKKMVIETIEFLTGRQKLERLYNEAHAIEGIRHAERWKAVLDKLELNIRYNEEQFQKIPKEGPLVLIANHPFGVVDGLTFGYLAALARPNFKIMVNGVLEHDHMLKEYLLPVDFRETREAMKINIKTKNEALKLLQAGGTILIFPAGGVDTASKIFNKPTDFPWKNFLLKLVNKPKATVVPLYFHGKNSIWFHLASFINMNLRLGLLLNEIRNKIGTDINITIGEPISYETMSKINRKELIAFLRAETLKLEHIKNYK